MKIGNMPNPHVGGRKQIEIDWDAVIELAQAHPGIPTVHDSLEDRTQYRSIAGQVQAKNGDYPPELKATLSVLGGKITARVRKTHTNSGEDRTLDRGDVWITWTPTGVE